MAKLLLNIEDGGPWRRHGRGVTKKEAPGAYCFNINDLWE